MKTYNGMISSDWSQCLSPNGPFDPLDYLYPDLKPDLTRIFRQYTGNEIPLGLAIDQVSAIVPDWPAADQLDRYLSSRFATYAGVPQLIQWCRRHKILFMVNTTGFAAYFQRVVANGMLPAIDVLSAQSKWRLTAQESSSMHLIELQEIEDKARNSAVIARKFSIPGHRIAVMGDSGGDGPHFEWGAAIGATLIGSMTKPSLRRYCSDRRILIHHEIGHIYQAGESISKDKESDVDFRSLIGILEPVMGTTPQRPMK